MDQHWFVILHVVRGRSLDVKSGQNCNWKIPSCWCCFYWTSEKEKAFLLWLCNELTTQEGQTFREEMLWSKLYKPAVTQISSWGGKIISATPLTGHTEGLDNKWDKTGRETMKDFYLLSWNSSRTVFTHLEGEIKTWQTKLQPPHSPSRAALLFHMLLSLVRCSYSLQLIVFHLSKQQLHFKDCPLKVDLDCSTHIYGD